MPPIPNHHSKSIPSPLRAFADMKPEYQSSTIQKALDILNLFHEHESMSFMEIQKRIGFNKSTLFRIIATLVHNHFLRKTESGRYELGLAIFILGHRIALERHLKSIASPLMKKLSDELQFTVHLGIIERDNIIIIEKAEPLRNIKMVSRVGTSVPAHCTSQGKTLLAFSPHETVERIVNAYGLNRFTPNTITTYDSLLIELEQIRKRGYAVDNSEHEKNIKCIGVPILDREGAVVAALSVTGLITDFPNEEVLGQCVRLLFKLRDDISREMGYQPQTDLGPEFNTSRIDH